MGKECEIVFTVDGKTITQDRILQKELERYQVAFDKLADNGARLKLNSETITRKQARGLPLDQAKEALAETKMGIGREGMLELLADSLAQSDAMWKDIADGSPYRENLQAGIVEVHAKGITLPMFMLFNQSLMKANDLYGPSKVHPEHYSFEAGKGGTQTIIETFGMYKEPSYLRLEPGKDGWRPIEPDADTVMSMMGNTYLAHGHVDTKLVGFHQFKPCDDGIKVKLGVFLPEAAPREILEGHKWHLLVEFNNALRFAALQHPNFLQNLILNASVKRMAKRNRL